MQFNTFASKFAAISFFVALAMAAPTGDDASNEIQSLTSDGTPAVAFYLDADPNVSAAPAAEAEDTSLSSAHTLSRRAVCSSHGVMTSGDAFSLGNSLTRTNFYYSVPRRGWLSHWQGTARVCLYNDSDAPRVISEFNHGWGARSSANACCTGVLTCTGGEQSVHVPGETTFRSILKRNGSNPGC